MGAGPKHFENSRVYLQWLNFRGAWPMRLDRRAKKWMWGFGIFFVAFVGLAYACGDNMGFSRTPVIIQILFVVCMFCASFFAFVLPVVYMLVDLLVHVPRAIHDDTTSTMLQAIMVTPVTTRSMLKDLTAWSIRLNLMHITPSLLVISAFFIANILQSRASGYGPSLSDILTVVILVAISVAALWHFLLITGLASATFPRWVWSTGSSLFFWVVPVLSGVIWATYKIMEAISDHRMAVFPRRIYFFGWDYHELAPWIAVLIAAILLEISTMLLARNLPRLMTRRRAGEWQ